MYVLVIHDPSRGVDSGARKQILLSDEQQTIGSAAGNSIVLRRDGIAPEHCVVERIKEGYKLVDLHTEQGTLVNGSYIAQKRLEPGDRIELSGCVLTFEQRVRSAARPSARSVRPDSPGADNSADSAVSADTQDSGVPGARRKRGSGGLRAARTALYTLTVVLLIAGIGSVLPGLLGRADGATFGQDRLRLAGVYEQMGYFTRAAKVLKDLEREADPGLAGARITTELERLAKLSFRQRLGREELAALVADQRRPAGEKLEQAHKLYDLFDDLPRVSEEIQERILELEPEARRAARRQLVSLVDLSQMSDQMLANRNFSGARNVWIGLRTSSLAGDGELLEAALAVVEAAADAEARELLTRVEEMVARSDYLGALIVLDDTELRAFRGTSAFGPLDSRAQELEALVSKLEPVDLVAGALPLERIGSDRNRPARSIPAYRREPEPARVALVGVEQAILGGDALFFEGRLGAALTSYVEGLGGQLSRAEYGRLTRRIERVRRAEWFLDSLENYIEADPDRVAGLVIADRTGERGGIIRGVRDGEFQVDSDGERFTLLPEQLRSSSAQALARSFKLDPEDQLNLIFYRMTDGIPAGGKVPREFRGLIQKFLKAEPAGESGERKGALDSAIAFLRGLPEVPEWGFFDHEGLWLSFKEREQARNRTAIRAAVAKLDCNGGKTYAAGLSELKSLLPVARTEVAEVLAVRRARMLKELLLASELGAIERLIATRQELGRRRGHALELIFDRDKYFYPYNVPACPPEKAKLYPKVQQEVDRRVALVRDLWGKEAKPPEGGVPISRRFNRLLTRLRAEQPLLMLGDPDGFREESQFRLLKLLPAEAGRITLRNIALDLAERKRLDRDERVLATNAQGPWVALRQEQEQVLITNQYRLMMGRAAVRIHDALVRSARKHCKWMSRSGTFSHINHEDAKLRTPYLRMVAQGYKSGGSGENIAQIGGALAAHNAWLHSSGHHRNILFASHRELGSGNNGSYWCQNFAGGQEYAGNLPEDL